MLTIGRIISGIIANRVSARSLVMAGELLILLGAGLLFINVSSPWFYVLAVSLIGLGSGPVFPNMMMLNITIFDKRVLSRVISLEMAIGYVGFGLLTPLAGMVFQQFGISLYPFLMAGVALLTLFLTRHLFKLKPELTP